MRESVPAKGALGFAMRKVDKFRIIDNCIKCEVYRNLAEHFARFKNPYTDEYLDWMHEIYVEHLDKEHLIR